MAEGETFKAGPEGGDSGGLASAPTQSSARLEQQKQMIQSVMVYLVMCIWIGVNAYILYGFCYNVLWHTIRRHHRKPAIAILVLTCFFNLHAMVSYFAIHLYGPGKIDDNYLKSGERSEDDAFVCDQEGYQLYCSYCQRVKPNRTHHSAHTDTCVPMMDHFCPWVGTVIGQGNYKFFIQFTWSIACALLVVFVTLLVYQHRPLPNMNGNSIALYIVTGVCLAFATALNVQHIFYLALSQTTLEHMSYRHNNPPFFNLPWRDSQRRVVQPSAKKIMIPHASPFSQGLIKNVEFVMGPIYTWYLPLRPPLTEPAVGKKFLQSLKDDLDDTETDEVKDS